MLRKSIITIAAVVSLGAAATLAPDVASAQMRGGGGGGGHITAGGGGRFVGGAGGHFSTRALAAHPGIHSRFAFHHRVAPVHHRFAFRHRFVHHRFAFRHRFVPFRHRFVFVGDSCFVLRHIWTPAGWIWRRVWVCG